MHRILIADPIAASGCEILAAAGAELHELTAGERPRLLDLVGAYDALVVRSTTQVDAALLRAGRRLKVVGRAGAGVDNVDVATATELGILVVNAPTANVLSAAEHTFALLLALARKVPAADAALKRGEWRRQEFMGSELAGRTLGIVGFGRIGRQVAVRARAFGMRVLASDPALDAGLARRLEVEALPLDDLLAAAEVVTLHLPLSDETHGLLDARRLGLLRQGALLVNCARGGLVDEPALLAALDEERLGGAALDVFEHEPEPRPELVRHPRVVATPHLGARTVEAQERIATETARMVVAALAGSLSVSAVNLPFGPLGRRVEPWLRLAERLGELAGALLGGGLRSVEVDLAGAEEALAVPVTVAATKGALVPLLGEGVSFVNAALVAERRGIAVRRAPGAGAAGPGAGVRVTLTGEGGAVAVGGTLTGADEPLVTGLLGFAIELRPAGRMLVLECRDIPGVIGRVGTILGDSGVNIAGIHISHSGPAGCALAVLRLDQEPEAPVMAALGQLPETHRMRFVELGRAAPAE